MKIFISHSGERSRQLAEHVASFMKQMIQATDPWISTGMDKGLKWLPEIAENLEASGMGIVCLTRDNLYSAPRYRSERRRSAALSVSAYEGRRPGRGLEARRHDRQICASRGL